MKGKFQQKDLVYLALGSNLGNRMENLRKAISELSYFFEIKQISHVIETQAILLENSPESWNIPYLNMVVSGKTFCDPNELLVRIKNTEKNIGRNLNADRWSPRIIDIDIISYYDEQIKKENLTIPHKEIKNRDFLQYLLSEIGYKIPKIDIIDDIENYQPLNHFVLFPKFAGIVNATPDSFSDGGCFLEPQKAEAQIRQLISDGAAIIDLGGQSTRPNFTPISASEELSRIDPVLERCSNVDCFSIDTYSDEVIQYIIKKYPKISCINLQQQNQSCETIKLLADNDKKIIVMMHGTDISYFDKKISELQNLGIQKKNIILDPGIGFQKSKIQNIEMVRNLREIRKYECEIMLAHSRKSFISYFSNKKNANERDLESIAISEFAFKKSGVDYLRVHNLKDHMNYFVADKVMNI